MKLVIPLSGYACVCHPPPTLTSLVAIFWHGVQVVNQSPADIVCYLVQDSGLHWARALRAAAFSLIAQRPIHSGCCLARLAFEYSKRN